MKRIVFHAGSVDGLLGPQTRGALVAFQSDYDLAITSAVAIGQRCRRWARRNTDTLEVGGAAQQCAARLLFFPADNFAATASNGVSLRF